MKSPSVLHLTSWSDVSEGEHCSPSCATCKHRAPIGEVLYCELLEQFPCEYYEYDMFNFLNLFDYETFEIMLCCGNES